MASDRISTRSLIVAIFNGLGVGLLVIGIAWLAVTSAGGFAVTTLGVALCWADELVP